MENDGIASAYGKPCVSCRKRKIKCDKTRPCSNCSRSKQLCTYESSDSSSAIPSDTRPAPSQSDGDVRERLARLEALMAKMMVRDTTSASPSASLEDSDRALNQLPTAAQLLAPTTPPLNERNAASVGQMIFQEGLSAYFDSDFWPGVITEIDDLRRLFDAPQGPNHPSTWLSSSMVGFGASPSSTGPSIHPTLPESNTLCKLFFEIVNPFMKVLHQSHFGKELDQFRRGTFQFPREFEALLFCIYLLAVNSLQPDMVKRTFSVTKSVLVPRFQHSAQFALSKVNFVTTDRVLVLQALLHYLTFLFQQNQAREAMTLLGVAARMAQNMGFHRDPSHFPYSPWVCELRRRTWNYLCCLDALALSSYGAESCLPATSDAQPPKNANDGDWHASRFAKPSSVPPETKGFKETTFVLARREIADLTVHISKLDAQDLATKERLVRETKISLDEKYLNHIDGGNPSQTVVAAIIEISLSSLRLNVRHRRTMQASDSTRDVEKYDEFIASLELLEAIEYHSSNFAPLNWEWLFQTVIPWLPTAIVLIYLPHATGQSDIDRGRKQIEAVFQRYSDPSYSTCPRWLLLIRLRQQMSQIDSEWDEGQGLTNPENGIRSGVMQDPALLFTDDLMLDFGAAGNMDPLMVDELDFQDMQDLPWLSTQMPL